MKTYLLITAFIAMSLTSIAQIPAAGPSRPTSMALNMGRVYGKLVDSIGTPLNDASVILVHNTMDQATKKMKSVLLKGKSSGANGEFSFEDVPVSGSLQLKISTSGFQEVTQNISLLPQGINGGKPVPAPGSVPSFEKDLGNIILTSTPATLQAVTVTTTRGMIMDIDKKVFNVDKNLVSTGGTALDVMKNVPSINVDIDGNVALRNKAPQIFVDGRPTTLTLEQIPADAIESVEVITNPSAKYDASGGGAGILNIVLKKNKKTGYNGNLRAGIDKRGAINSGADFNIRQGKVNFFASVNMNQMKGRTTGITDRLNLTDVPQTSIFQNNFNKTNGAFVFGRAGMDYFISNRTTLSLSGFKVHGEFNPYEFINISTDSLYSNGIINKYSERTSTGNREFNGQGMAFGLKYLFPKQGKELTADASYFSGKSQNSSLYSTNLYKTGSATEVNNNLLQKMIGSGNDYNIILQTDFVNPISATTKLETGLRSSIRSRTNNNDNYFYDGSINDYKLIPSTTSNYTSADNVYAAYVSVSSTINNFGYKLGVRAESSDYRGELTNTGEKFSNKYPVSLFPSLFLSQKLGSKQELQMSVTRRINRPNFFQLIPFVDFADPLNITKGNPGLVPEFTSSLEMSYAKTFQKSNSFLASVYYKKTNNLITRFQDKEINPFTGDEAIVSTYINANSSMSYGSELTTQLYPTKWLDFTTNLNIYNSSINSSNIDKAIENNSMWSYFGKFNSNFKLPSNFTMQLSATYQSKTNLVQQTGGGGFGGPGGFGQAQSAAQGFIRPSYGVDFAVKKTFLPGNVGSVTLSVSDIFKTRNVSQYSESAYFIQDYSRLRDPQMVKLTFAYRFGKIDASLFKRKNNNAGQASSDMQ